MHQFHFKQKQLYCEGVPVAHVAQKVGTPLYLYSYQTILDHFKKLQKAFASVHPLICYAVKANGSLAICRALAQAGAGFDVVSGGELKKVLQIGARPEKIVFASVGKTRSEVETALKAKILCFNVESVQELEQIQEICLKRKTRQWVSLRFNPDVDAHTHAFISTGKGENKFGMDQKTIESIFARKIQFPNLILGGIHLHIGSQILEALPYQKAIRKALSLIDIAREDFGIEIRTLNIGGGLGIVYHQETPQTAQEFASKILPLLKKRKLQIILEPGRFIVGNSGILLTQVLVLKRTPSKIFAIVDAAMNDLIRPSLYGAHHEIVSVIQKNGSQEFQERYDVVGPVCESGDFFAKDRTLPPLQPGDLMAILGAGAYGFVMASNYNARPRAAEVLCKGNRWYLIRKRESYQDLVRNEQLPPFLKNHRS